MDAGTNRLFVFLVLVGTVYALAAGILIRNLLRRFKGVAPPLKNAQLCELTATANFEVPVLVSYSPYGNT